MAYDKEQCKLLKEYYPKIKKELGVKWAVRFKVLAYYFPELIEKTRIKNFIKYVKADALCWLRLKSYTNEQKYYGKRFDNFINYDGSEPMLHIKNFFKEFCI